ncbi:MAG: hypothetical protein ACP5PA_02640 [Elusimicrobiales bacterium]
MRRIRGLKIPIRYYDIEKKIRKNSIDLVSIFGRDDVESNLKNFISTLASYLKITLIYDTFEPSKDEILKEIVYDKKSHYASFGFITLGSYIDEKKKSIDDSEIAIFNIFIDVVSQTVFDTTKDIIDEEAKKEKLQVGDILFIYEPHKKLTQATYHLYNILNPSSDGIELKDETIFPLNSWLIAVPWIASRK